MSMAPTSSRLLNRRIGSELEEPLATTPLYATCDSCGRSSTKIKGTVPGRGDDRTSRWMKALRDPINCSTILTSSSPDRTLPKDLEKYSLNRVSSFFVDTPLRLSPRRLRKRDLFRKLNPLFGRAIDSRIRSVRLRKCYFTCFTTDLSRC